MSYITYTRPNVVRWVAMTIITTGRYVLFYKDLRHRGLLSEVIHDSDESIPYNESKHIQMFAIITITTE